MWSTRPKFRMLRICQLKLLCEIVGTHFLQLDHSEASKLDCRRHHMDSAA